MPLEEPIAGRSGLTIGSSRLRTKAGRTEVAAVALLVVFLQFTATCRARQALEPAAAPAAIEELTVDAGNILATTRHRPLGIRIVDDRGRTVPTASNAVTFSVTGAGRLRGVGNGDPSCHEPEHGSRRTAFHGLCMTIIQASRTAGQIGVKAESAGLTSAIVSIMALAGGASTYGFDP